MKKISNTKKQRTPIAVISTDWHVKDGDEHIKDLIKQKCDLADDIGVDILFCLGDVFTSRSGQKVDTLSIMSDVFNYIHERGKELWVIPGNHDKQQYDAVESFLTPYKHFPGIRVVDRSAGLPIGDCYIAMLPYFKEDLWLSKLKELIEFNGDMSDKKYILLSHQAVNGSRNNDGSEVECGIAHKDLSTFDYVYLGHYHDYQQPFQNTYHLPSIKQNNFGENDNKGFTVLMDDGSFEIVNSSFKAFIKHKIDLSKVDIKEVLKQVRNNINPEINQRWELIGSKSLLKSVPKAELESLGVSIILTDVELESFVQYAEEEIVEYNQQSIIDEFKEFCDERGYDVEKGTNYLKNKLGI